MPLPRRSRGITLRLAALCATSLALLAPGSALARNVYAASFGAGKIAAIDSRTNQLIGNLIDLEGAGPIGIAITPDGKTLYAADNKTESVSVIDTRTNQVVGMPIPVGKFPWEVAISPDGTHAYVTIFGSNSVSVIDTRTNQVVGAPIPVGSGPEGIAITPDGGRAYVANIESDNVSVIDTRTNQVVGAPIPVGDGPSAIAFTPDGSRAYVTNANSDNVSAIDTRTAQVVAPPIAVGKNPDGIAVAPDGGRAYVANGNSDSVSVIDTRTNQTLPEITGLSGPEYLAIAPDGKTAYVGIDPSAVGVVDITTNRVTGMPIPVGESTGGIAVTPDQPPAASFAVARRARPGVPVSFDASASSDPDGAIATYAWAFGDGGAASLGAPRAKHVFRAPGTYRAALTVTDQEGCSTGFVFTGQTASCNGSARAATAAVVHVAYPGVRVRCPRSARPHGCAFALRVVAARPKGGRKPRAQTAVATARIKAGHTSIVSLKPTKAFRARLAGATRVLLEETARIGASRTIRYREAKIVQ